MFAHFALAALAVASLSSTVSGLVVPRKSPPKGWAFGYLEDYQTYHTRYLAIGCQNHHNEPFFDQCCHPMLATETLKKNRAPWCIPSASASASASAAEPTSTVKTPEDDDEDDYEDCDEEYDDDDDSDDQTTSTPAPAPVPKPTTTKKEETTTKPKPVATTTKTTATSKPTPDGSNNTGNTGGSSQIFSGGFATFFYQNGVAGACGKVHKDTDLVAAIDGRRYGNLGAKSSLCGKKVKLTNTKNGKSVNVVIADACPTCTNNNSIDLSVSAFKAIAPLDDGLVSIKWSFV